METIEYIIRPDGRVEQKIVGVKGTRCVDVTAPIEAELGKVLHEEKTGEYFEEPVTESVTDDLEESLPTW